MRVLLVDDDLAIRTVLWRELKSAFDVLVSPDAGHASTIMSTESELIAVVSDFDLGPGGNGLEVLSEASVKHPSSYRMLVSGSDGMAELARKNPRIIHAHLPKPWPPSGVRDMIVGHLLATKRLAAGSQPVAKASRTSHMDASKGLLVEVDVRFTDWSLFRLVRAREVSMGGMVLPMTEKPDLGQEVSLTLHLPGGGHTVLVSRVARVSPADAPSAATPATPYEVSVEFTRVSAEQRAVLADAIALLAARGRGQAS